MQVPHTPELTGSPPNTPAANAGWRRRLGFACRVAGFLALIAGASAGRLLAQPYSFDGDGNATMGSPINGGPYPMPFQMASDPSGGITNAPVLIYSLEFPVVPGDVALVDSNGTVVDLLRFLTPSGSRNSSLIFYTRADDPGHRRSSVGIPYSANPIRIGEVSPTTLWAPTRAGEPGLPTAPFPVSFLFKYNINLVAAPSPPVYLSGTNLVWKFTGGFTNALFYVVASDSMATPPGRWTRVRTNQFDGAGNSTLILPVAPDHPGRFYRIALP